MTLFRPRALHPCVCARRSGWSYLQAEELFLVQFQELVRVDLIHPYCLQGGKFSQRQVTLQGKDRLLPCYLGEVSVGESLPVRPHKTALPLGCVEMTGSGVAKTPSGSRGNQGKENPAPMLQRGSQQCIDPLTCTKWPYLSFPQMYSGHSEWNFASPSRCFSKNS